MSATLTTDSSRRNAHGFTLIEIIAVLGIIGIMSAVTVTIFSSLYKYKLTSEVEILKTHLRYAQSRAMNDTMNDTVPFPLWGIGFSTGSYELQKNGSPASTLPNETDYTHTLAGVTLVAPTPTEVTFDIWGSPGASDITIRLSAGETRDITVTANTGFIQ